MEEKETIKNFMQNKIVDIEKLMKQYYPYVYKIIENSKNGNISNEDMEEMISDVFLAVWKNCHKLEKNLIELKPYIAGITKNIIKNHYRKSKLEYSITDYEEVLADTENLEVWIEEYEQNRVILNTLKELKKEEYQIFILFYYESKKIKEIAKKLEISESKVKIILYRLRKRIKRELKKKGYEGI